MNSRSLRFQYCLRNSACFELFHLSVFEALCLPFAQLSACSLRRRLPKWGACTEMCRPSAMPHPSYSGIHNCRQLLSRLILGSSTCLNVDHRMSSHLHRHWSPQTSMSPTATSCHRLQSLRARLKMTHSFCDQVMHFPAWIGVLKELSNMSPFSMSEWACLL